jgi:hypothetical protein
MKSNYLISSFSFTKVCMYIYTTKRKDEFDMPPRKKWKKNFLIKNKHFDQLSMQDDFLKLDHGKRFQFCKNKFDWK